MRSSASLLPRTSVLSDSGTGTSARCRTARSCACWIQRTGACSSAGRWRSPQAPSGSLAISPPRRYRSGASSSRTGAGRAGKSPRNAFVAAELSRAGIATLLLDLLTSAEELDRGNVFDIALLAERLTAATRWVGKDGQLLGLRIGYFGASTGAAAALIAAADLRAHVSAVVSRGGRPDLAAERLAEVTAPTLLIVGGADEAVLGLNRSAAALLRCPHELAVVPGATHLFEEPGALEGVTELARAWFVRAFRQDGYADAAAASTAAFTS
jgi:dienelactone hydrolase